MTEFCFIPNATEVFTLAEIISRDSVKKEAVVHEIKSGKSVTMKIADLTPIASMDELDNPPSDLIKLIYVHRPGILNTLRTRFLKDQIYTSIGPILVALNPFKWITGVYGEEVMLKYKTGQANSSEDPHVFATAHDAFRDLYLRQNQSLIISGESGAGKTEATKQCLNYLAYSAGSSSGIQSKILKASPILEAWGNAKTLRNNNSSRFGKFIEIWFDSNQIISGSSNTTYILEKSRVVFQEANERNYHVFYQLLKGADTALLNELNLVEFARNPECVQYINQSGCIAIDDVDDGNDYREVKEAFAEIGFTIEEEKALYSLIAGILHFGNLTFEQNPANSEESVISAASLGHLRSGSNLFKVDLDAVQKALLFKKIKSGGGRRTSVAFASYLVPAAVENRNALVKEIYKRAFDWIVAKINELMHNDPERAINMIGILDIFGFEIFKKNSFEQLCINLANEALQQHFNYNIFQAEIELYSNEMVPVPPLEYKDNQDVLDLILKRPKGLIPMLDEEGNVPKGSWEGFISKFSKHHANNPRFRKQAKQRQEELLGVAHYAGDVFYDVSLFLVKNKDTLSADLIEVFSVSSLPLLHQLFDEDASGGVVTPAPSGSNKRMSTTSSSQQDAKMTVGKKFSMQLEKLIANLNSTKPRYIRCVKPNQVKKPNIFEPFLTNEQLTYSGVFEAVIIMQNGYPFRFSLEDFRSNYHMLLLKHNPVFHSFLFDKNLFNAYSAPDAEIKSVVESSRIFSREQCQFMVSCIAEQYDPDVLIKCHVGKTTVFYQSAQHSALRALKQQIIDKSILTVQKVSRGYATRQIINPLRKEEREWIAAIHCKDVATLKAASLAIAECVSRLNRIQPQIKFTMDTTDIGLKYSAAVELEQRLTEQIRNLLDNKEKDIMDKYDTLDSMLHGAQCISFSATYRGIVINLHWTQNQSLVEFVEKVRIMGVSVTIKRKLLSGIAKENEVELEAAIKELTNLRIDGQVDEEFCKQESASANKIILNAKVQLDNILELVTTSIESGRLTIKNIPDSFELDITVDASPLTLFLENEKISRNSGNNMVSSKRVELLLNMCSQLRDLRHLSQQGCWGEVWDLIQLHWNAVLSSLTNNFPENFQEAQFSDAVPSINPLVSSPNSISTQSGIRPPPPPPPPMPKVVEGGFLKNKLTKITNKRDDETGKLFIPAAIQSQILAEVKVIALSALTYFIVPKLQYALSHDGVPAIPALGPISVTDLDTSELKAQIAAADLYVSYLDNRLTELLLQAKEHLVLREAISSGDRIRVLHLVTGESATDNLQHIPTDHTDIINAKHFKQLYGVVTRLQDALVLDRPQPQDETVTAISDKNRVKRLEEGCAIANNFVANGEAWIELLDVCNTILTIRMLLRDEQLDEASAFLQKLFKENPQVGDVHCSVVSFEDGSGSNWHKIYRKLLENKLNECIASSVRSAADELLSYRAEILHAQAVRAIMSALSCGTVSSDMNGGNVHYESLFSELEKQKPALKINSNSSALLRDSHCIVKLRKLICLEDWLAIEDIITPIRAASTTFDSCHEACREELLCIYNRLLDYKMRIKLSACLKHGQISLVTQDQTVDVGMRIDTELISTATLAEAIAVANDVLTSVNAFSDSVNDLFLAANSLYCLRQLLLQNNWEPEELIFCGSCPTEALSEKIGNMGKVASLIKHARNIDALLLEIEKLDEIQPQQNIVLYKLIAKTNIVALSVSEVLCFLSSYPSVEALISEEVSVVRRVVYDRRYRIVLLLSACNGCTSGTLDKFNYRQVATQQLVSAITYVGNRISKYPSKLALNWLHAAEYLLTVREAVLKSCSVAYFASVSSVMVNTVSKIGFVNDNNSTEDYDDDSCRNDEDNDEEEAESITRTVDLADLLSTKDIRRMLENTTTGFPFTEFELVLSKITDQVSFQELSSALLYGGPVFTDGRFDISRLQYDHLLERLDLARKAQSMRSDRLDRLFFYAELCINMRIALADGHWELSERGERSNVTSTSGGAFGNSTNDRSLLTVKRSMNEYDQANKFFRSHMKGVPPTNLIEEFRLVGREWQRRLLKKRFSTAFEAGAIQGTPFCLNLLNIRTDLLEAEINRVQLVEAESGEVDNDVRRYQLAAEELIAIRNEAKKIHSSYKQVCRFGTASNSLRYIIETDNFIPDAIRTAVNTIEAMRRPPYKLVQEWDRMSFLVKNHLSACLSIPSTNQEVKLVVAETSDREYLSQVLQSFHRVQSALLQHINGTENSLNPNDEKINTVENLVNELCSAINAHDERRELQQRQQLSKDHKHGSNMALVRYSPVLEFMRNSAAVLVHFLRSKNLGFYESFHRDWREDANFARTPRISALLNNLSGKYEMQTLLRASVKVALHRDVRYLLDVATKQVEDFVSESEILEALTDAQYKAAGSVGLVTIPAKSVSKLLHVVSRIDTIGIYDEARLGELRAACTVLMQLREVVQRRNYTAAFAVLDDFLGNGKRSFDFVLRVIAQDNYRIAMQARPEFILLVQDTCDGYWRQSMHDAMMRGAVTGIRGALRTHLVSWQQIKKTLGYLDLMQHNLSASSEKVKLTAELVLQMRITLVNGTPLFAIPPSMTAASPVSSRVSTASFVIASTDLSDDSTAIFNDNNRINSRFNLLHLERTTSLQYVSLIQRLVADYTQDIIFSANKNVEALARVNVAWLPNNVFVGQDEAGEEQERGAEGKGKEMNNILKIVQEIVDSLNVSVAATVASISAKKGPKTHETAAAKVLTTEKDLSSSCRDCLLKECVLVSSHCESLLAGHKLEAAIQQQDGLMIRFCENGLEVFREDGDKLGRAVSDASIQRWKQHQDYPQEYWWAALHALARSFQSFMTNIGLAGINNVESSAAVNGIPDKFIARLDPGTERFSQCIFVLYSLIRQADVVKRDLLQYRGLRKRSYLLPAGILHACEQLRLAASEHILLTSVDKIILADKTITYLCDNKMDIAVFRMQPVCIPGFEAENDIEDDTEKLLLLSSTSTGIAMSTKAADYEGYGERLKAALVALSVYTVLGKALVGSVLDLLEFRIAVAGNKWFIAKRQSIVGIRFIQEFPSRSNDVAVFREHLRYIELRRALENAIQHCCIPNIVGWSLHSSTAHNLVVNIDDITLSKLLQIVEGISVNNNVSVKEFESNAQDCRELLEKHAMLAELVAIGKSILDLVAALRTGLWISMKDIEIAITTALAAASPVPATASSFALLSRERSIAITVRNKIIETAKQMKQEVLTFKEEVPAMITQRLNRSIFQAVMELEDAASTSRSPTIAPYMSQYLTQCISNLKTELVVVQLEHLAKQTFEQNAVVGNPGQLIIRENALNNMRFLTKCLEADITVVKGCHNLRRALHASKIICKVLSAHIAGDLSGLCKFVDLLSYLRMLDCHPGELPASQPTIKNRRGSVNTFNTKSSLGRGSVLHPNGDDFLDELLKIDDFTFSHQFSIQSMPVLLATRGLGHAQEKEELLGVGCNNDGAAIVEMCDFDLLNTKEILSDHGEVMIQNKLSIPYLDEKFITSKAAATFSLSVNDEFSGAMVLREEVAEYLPLLFKHAQLEMCYAEYSNAVKKTPARGEPGELHVEGINVGYLNSLLKKLSFQQEEYEKELSLDVSVSNNRFNYGFGKILLEATKCLILIRKGQLNVDESMITSGIEIAKLVAKLEKDYDDSTTVLSTQDSVLSTVVLFGGYPKRISVLASKEVELAEQDLKQRIIIQKMTAALATPGIPTTSFPFDLSSIRIHQLEEAYKACDMVLPTCKEAQHLYQATAVILALRNFIVVHDWTAVKAYLNDINIENMDNIFAAHTIAEYNASKHVMAVSLAIELSFKAYYKGYITGTLGSIKGGSTNDTLGNNSGEVKIDIVGVQQALDAFLEVEDHWINAAVREHRNTCECLLVIREYAVAEDWARMHHATTTALRSAGFGVQGSTGHSYTNNNRRPSHNTSQHSLYASVVPEIQFAADHSAYMVTSTALRTAILQQGVTGAAGNVVVAPDLIDISILQRAYATAQRINCNHDDIVKLVKAVELLFLLRKAALLGHWLEVDHTKSYLSLLSADFRYEEVSNRQKLLSQTLELTSAAEQVIVEEEEYEEEENEEENINEDNGSCDATINDDLSTRSVEDNIQSDNDFSSSSQTSVLGNSLSNSILAEPVSSNNNIFPVLPTVRSPSTSQLSHNFNSIVALTTKSSLPVSRRSSITRSRASMTNVARRALGSSSRTSFNGGVGLQSFTATTIQAILFDWDETKKGGTFASEALPEIDLIYAEMRYRYIVSELIHTIHSPGVAGEPGAVDTSGAVTRLLERAITLATKYYPEIYQYQQTDSNSPKLAESELNPAGTSPAIATVGSDCRLLLRDAKILLQGRRYRVGKQWAKLQKLLMSAEKLHTGFPPVENVYFPLNAEHDASSESEFETNELFEVYQLTEGHKTEVVTITNRTYNSDQKQTNVESVVEPIVKPVWDELKLLKYDCLFQLRLCDFANEMIKQEKLTNNPVQSSKYINKRESTNASKEGVVKIGNVYVPDVKTPKQQLKYGSFTDDISSTAVVDSVARIETIKRILESTIIASDAYPTSKEFQRLIEAQSVAWELRQFAHTSPNKSPQDIINIVARVKKRDIEEGVASYMSLLIYEISKMSNVLDFPLNLKIIHREIIHGQRYINNHPVGTLGNRSEIDLEVISAAYQAAVPSLEIMGTEENHKFMQLADAVIKMRKALISGDNGALEHVLEQYEEILTKSTSSGGALVAAEVQRLRIEMENNDAGRLMEMGLKNGRYIDVVSIAKMVNHYEARMSAKTALEAKQAAREKAQLEAGSPLLQQVINLRRSYVYDDDDIGQKRNNNVSIDDEDSNDEFGDDENINSHDSIATKYHINKRGSRRTCTTQRLSMGMARVVGRFEGSNALDKVADDDEEEELCASPVTQNSAMPYIHTNSNLRASALTSNVEYNATSASDFIHGVISSISALNRAVAIALQVQVRSPNTEYYLHAAQVILQLRENIVADNWDEVKKIVQQQPSTNHSVVADVDNPAWELQQLPATALEEILAVREGLIYQASMARISRAFCEGAVSGVPHEIIVEDISYQALDDAIDAIASSPSSISKEQMSTIDPSAAIMIETARKLRDIRYYVATGKWLDMSSSINNFKTVQSCQDSGATRADNNASNIALCRGSTVDGAVEDFLEYQTEQFPKLQEMLGIANKNNEPDNHFQQHSTRRTASMTAAELYSEAKVVLRQSVAMQDPVNRTGSVTAGTSLFVQQQHSRPTSPLFSIPNKNVTTSLLEKVDDWVQYQWQSVLHVVMEVNLVQQVILYRKVLLSLTTAVESTPDAVKLFMGDLRRQHYRNSFCPAQVDCTIARSAVSWEPQLTALHHYEDAVLCGTISKSSMYRRASVILAPRRGSIHLTMDGVNIIDVVNNSEVDSSINNKRSYQYYVDDLQLAAKQARDYLSTISFETSEDMLKLQHTANLLLEFRSALCSATELSTEEMLCKAPTKMTELLHRARHMSTQQVLSTEYGIYELRAYITATEQSAVIQAGLLEAIESGRVFGPLDDLTVAGKHHSDDEGHEHYDADDYDDYQFELDKLADWIERSRNFLNSGGGALSLGIPALMLEARVIHKLRILVSCNDWNKVNMLLQQHSTQAHKWTYVKHEFFHIEQAYMFRCCRTELFQALASFNSIADEADLKHGHISLNVDFQIFNRLISKLKKIIHYCALASEHHNYSHPDILSDTFFQHPSTIASVALWKLLQVLLNGQWFIKKFIHDNTNQKVCSVLDPLLLGFFGLKDSNYLDNCINDIALEVKQQILSAVLSPDDDDRTVDFAVSSISAESSQLCFSSELTVFNILVSTNWINFPFNVRKFFDCCRNQLIDSYLRSDLEYYCTKGSATLDAVGNIVVSDLYLRFLEISITDANRAINIAMSLHCKMIWTADTEKWLSAAILIAQCRTALIVNKNIDQLSALLREQGLLRGGGAPNFQLCILPAVYNELIILEKYVLGYQAEQVLQNVIEYFSSTAFYNNNNCVISGAFSADVLSSIAVNALYELVTSPASTVEPSVHHLEMMQIARLLKEAIHLALIGAIVRLTSILNKLNLHFIDKLHDSNIAQFWHKMDKATTVLQKICKRAFQSDLLDYDRIDCGRATDSTSSLKPLDFSNNKCNQFSLSLNTGSSSNLNNQHMTTATPNIAGKQRIFTKSRSIARVIYAVAESTTSASTDAITNLSSAIKSLPHVTADIITAICELLYFAEDGFEEISDYSSKRNPSALLCSSTDNLKRMLPLSSKSQAPYYCYLRLDSILNKLDDAYMVYEPRWVTALLIILYYLKSEVSVLLAAKPGEQLRHNQIMSKSNDNIHCINKPIAVNINDIESTTMLNLPRELLLFCFELNLDKLILAVEINIDRHSKKTARRSSLSGNIMQQSSYCSNSSAFVDAAPNIVLLVKQLTTIKNHECKRQSTCVHSDNIGHDCLVYDSKLQNYNSNNDFNANPRLFWLQRGLQEVQFAANRVNAATATNSDNDVILQSLPIGSVGRAITQSKLLTKLFQK